MCVVSVSGCLTKLLCALGVVCCFSEVMAMAAMMACDTINARLAPLKEANPDVS